MNVQDTLKVRRANERGHANHGWLDSYHSFSFAGYFDPEHMGFRTLRVINDDTVDAGNGFGAHPHQDMEIISYVIEGQLKHKDSMGNGSVINAGEFQKITAGSGIVHSEFNPSDTDKTHFLQIWIMPDERGLAPSYQELKLNGQPREGGLLLVGSPNEEDGVIWIHQDVYLYHGKLDKGEENVYSVAERRGLWLQLISGRVTVNGIELNAGDGLSTETEQQLKMIAGEDAQFLLFDLG